MGNIFNPDNRFMRMLNQMADLMILNLLTLLCSLPVLTAGAALTAMHTVLLKSVRGEDGALLRTYFNAFKANFRQATLMWLIFLLAGALLGTNLYVIACSGFETPRAIYILNLIIIALISLTMLYAFPVLSRFHNTVWGTLKSAAVMMAASIPQTLGMASVSLMPVALLYFAPQVLPIVLAFCFTGPGWLCAQLYSPIFKRFEPEESDRQRS